MKDIKVIITFAVAFQVFATFGQTKFHLGKYKMNNEQVIFKADSTFEYTGPIGCMGNTTTSGKFAIKKDTLILDTGIPVEWKEYARKDDSLKIIVLDALTNKPLPNVRVAFKFIPKTSNYLLTDKNGSISLARQLELDSIFIDRGVIEWYKDTAMLNLHYSFFNDYPDGKYRLRSSKGADIVIQVNMQLLDKYVIMNKEKWLIIDENKIFEPKPDWTTTKGLTFTRTEK